MRKFIASILAVTAALSVITACGKSDSSSSTLKGSEFGSEVGSLQPDPLAPTDSTEGSNGNDGTTENSTDGTDNNGSATTTSEDSTLETQADPLGGGAFSYDENGAIVFNEPDVTDERTLMAAAQMLFQSACKTEWDFKFDSPFQTDDSKYITNEFGWQFRLITEPGIKSFADVENEYNKVFSSKYPNDLKDNYIEQDGAVYELFSARGSNIFYSVSKITAVKSITEDEIFFTVTNYYDGTDKDPSATRSEEAEFSAVIDENGTWHAGLFTLPY